MQVSKILSRLLASFLFFDDTVALRHETNKVAADSLPKKIHVGDYVHDRDSRVLSNNVCSSPEQPAMTLKSWFFGHENGGSGKASQCEDLCRDNNECKSWMWRNSANACYLSNDNELKATPSGCCHDHHAHTFNRENCYQPSTTAFVEVASKSCEGHGLIPITDTNECKLAAIRLGKTIKWGPHGGYEDVVDGCSARFGDDNSNLFINQVGTCKPNVHVGQWTYTNCECTAGQPCMCSYEVPSIRHVPNTYCEYYSSGGDGGCSEGISFAEAWHKCDEDGSDVRMGVMWNSCEGETSNTDANGAWKLISAGQDVGDADHTTETCGGKEQALGHWDVYVRYEVPLMRHIANTYCEYYSSGGDGDCSEGVSFTEAWRKCDEDGSNACMGVMWNSCEGAPSNTDVNGAWKLIRAGQNIGDADNPTDTCGGREQALGHWDAYVRYEVPPMLHIPNTYCEDYSSGGDGDCSEGISFAEVWRKCDEDGSDVCMGVMWNPCKGKTSNTDTNGAWKLISAGQDVGDADHATETCGGKEQALGHWDVYVRYEVPPIRHIANTYCEYYASGGDGDCSEGMSFADAWHRCDEDGKDVCMGVMWNSCKGGASNRDVNGAWKLMSAGQSVGDANIPTDTCGGKEQALGHWDVFIRYNEEIDPSLALSEQNVTLQAARQLWQSNLLSDYNYRYQRICECLPPTNEVVVVHVRRDAVESVAIEGNSTVPNSYASMLQTINELFDQIQGYIDRGSHVLSVTYDTEFGYPRSISVDEDKVVAHDEEILTITDLVPVSVITATNMGKDSTLGSVSSSLAADSSSTKMGSRNGHILSYMSICAAMAAIFA